jgi:hypothetical protein
MSTRKPSKQVAECLSDAGSTATPSPTLAADARVAAARAAAFTTANQAEAFAHFRPLAEAIPKAGLAPSPGKLALVRSNITEALRVLSPELSAVAAAMTNPPLQEVLELPAVALALSFAAARVPARSYSPGEIAAARSELAPLRDVTLTYLEVAAHPAVGLVPAARVQAIRAGKGPVDNAQDGVAIAGLFDEFAPVLEGKHPFAPAQLRRLEEIGNMLVATLQPAGAVPAPAAEPHEAAVLRDQFEALLVERFELLKLCAAVALKPARAQALIPALRRAAVAPSGAAGAPEGDEPAGA